MAIELPQRVQDMTPLETMDAYNSNALPAHVTTRGLIELLHAKLRAQPTQADFHKALAAVVPRLTKKQQGQIMGAYRNATGEKQNG